MKKEIRISVNRSDIGYGGDGLKLCVYAVRWSLAEVIPAGFFRSGSLALGNLVLTRDDHQPKTRGEYSVSRVTGCPSGSEYDYVCLPLDCLGHFIIEPVAPFSSQAEVDGGQIAFEKIPAWEFIPRRWRGNLAVERIRDALRAVQGDISEVERRLGTAAREALKAARAGVNMVQSPQIEFIRMVEQMVAR